MSKDIDPAELREIFSHFDTDNNNVIDRDEFAAFLKALDATISAAEVETGLKALDANNNGTIEFDEFVAWWTDR